MNNNDTNAKPTTQRKNSTSKSSTSKESSKELTFNERLQLMVKEISETDQKIDIDGRKYTTVAKRNEVLRKHLGFDVQTATEFLHVDTDKVIAKCQISIYRDGQWQLVATGFAEESRSSNEMNKQSALEIAETSAIGRALANLGLSGGEFASLNEMASKTGLVGQASPELIKHVKSVLKLSGMSEKSVLASLSIKSFDTMKDEEALKILKKALLSIETKNAKTKSPNEAVTNDDEKEIKL